ncbi:MAG TPA: CBS domain-containing protein [Longimicrobiales bacterium]
MTAKEIMTAPPACCTPKDPAQEAVRLMQEKNCGLIPVVDDRESARLVGVVTDRDIALRGVGRGAGADTPVRDLMSTDISCCGPDDDLGQVERIMEARQVRRVPVVDDDGRCIGIIAQADLAMEEGRATTEEEIGRVVERISEPTDGPRAEREVGIRIR